MPTIWREGRYRFSFFSNERNAPPHVHIKAGGDEAKFWLEPVEFESSYGFNVRELNEIERIIERKQQDFIEARHEHFPD